MNLRQQLYESNSDLRQRFKKEKISSKYLRKEDVMLITIGKPKASYSLTIADGLLDVHYNPTNYKINGFTVLYVKEFIGCFEQLSNSNKNVEKEAEKANYKPLVEPIANLGMTSLSFA